YVGHLADAHRAGRVDHCPSPAHRRAVVAADATLPTPALHRDCRALSPLVAAGARQHDRGPPVLAALPHRPHGRATGRPDAVPPYRGDTVMPGCTVGA